MTLLVCKQLSYSTASNLTDSCIYLTTINFFSLNENLRQYWAAMGTHNGRMYALTFVYATFQVQREFQVPNRDNLHFSMINIIYSFLFLWSRRNDKWFSKNHLSNRRVASHALRTNRGALSAFGAFVPDNSTVGSVLLLDTWRHFS